MLKKLGSILMLAVLLTVFVTGCASSSNAAAAADGEVQKLKVAFAIPGSISDGAFGTISYKGIEAVKDEPFIEKADYIEGVNAATDAAKAIRDYVADGYDVVWAQSGLHSAAVMEIAPEFPETVFVALGTPPSDMEFDNVWFNLTECEGAYYIVGTLAAQMSQSGTIGFVGGRENPLYVACSKAYEEGAKSINPDIKVSAVFTGDYGDPIKAKEASVSQIQNGADVITHVQDLGMTGVVAAAEEATQGGSQVWVIGKGSDQYDQAPDVMLSSVVFDYGVVMRDCLSAIANGEKSGSMPLSVPSGSVYLADFRSRVPEDVVKNIDELTEKIKAGDITYTTQYDVE